MCAHLPSVSCILLLSEGLQLHTCSFFPGFSFSSLSFLRLFFSFFFFCFFDAVTVRDWTLRFSSNNQRLEILQCSIPPKSEWKLEPESRVWQRSFYNFLTMNISDWGRLKSRPNWQLKKAPLALLDAPKCTN